MKLLRQLILAVTLLISASAASAQTCVTTEGVTTCTYGISDDGYAVVPIPFGFPYYGRVFTHSIFFDNGVVSFYDPVSEGMRLGGQQFNAQPLSNNIGSNFHYSIMPLWTDLVNYNGRYFTETDGQGFLRYNWENISQWGHPDRLNTFSLEIQPSGYIGINYQQINISGYPVTAGLVGNASLGEWQQHFYAPGSQPVSTGSISNWSVNETVPTDCPNPLSNPACPGYAEALFQQQCSNPLYSPACPGYSEAYFTQQCSISSLYDPSCPGYAVAYYDYQCGVDPLYHTGCPGYADAFFSQQCSLNTLYNESCPGYALAFFNQQCALNPLYNEDCDGYDDAFYVQQCTADPLYDSGCTGYDEAYFTQQCSLNSLYSSDCPGYAVAYFDQQCSLNTLYNEQCPGYAEAYYNQQCSINSLYDSGCPGYTTAFFNQQCGLSALYNEQCPGYAEAYYSQQCSLDALYDNGCPGYAEAYAKKYILGISSDPTPVVAVVEETAPAVETLVVEELLVVVETVAEVAVETVAREDSQSPTSVENLSAAPATTSSPSPAPARTAAPSRTAPATTKQALAEQRLAAAREAAAEAARENPAETTAAMDSAESMEQQAEIQNVVIGAMGFVAGFDAYGRATIPDAAGYRPFEIYPGQRNVDTPAARGLLGRSDRLHQEMIDEQWNR